MSYEIEVMFEFVNRATAIELFFAKCGELNFHPYNQTNLKVTFNDLLECYKATGELDFWLNIEGAELACSIFSNLISITFFNYKTEKLPDNERNGPYRIRRIYLWKKTYVDGATHTDNVKPCELLLQLASPFYVDRFSINESKQDYSLFQEKEVVANCIQAYLRVGMSEPDQEKYWAYFVKCLDNEYWECFIINPDGTRLTAFELIDKLDEMDKKKPISLYIEKDNYITKCEVNDSLITLTPYGEVKKKVINNHSQTDIEFYLRIILNLGDWFGLGEMRCTIN